MDAEAPLDVLIVGAGISGIGMAAHLAMDAPAKTYALLERRARLGGTWDLFRYPGVRSDSDMFTLGFAFAPWRAERSIAAGETIRDYLEQVAAEHGVAERIHYGRKVIAADWDSAAGLWRVSAEGPDGPETHQARFLFMGSGYYDHDNPHDPGIPGLERFAGTVVHPQFWPEGLEWAGKRVVVIGSGATAATVVPAMAASAAHVTMLQRTPTWYVAQAATDRLANVVRRVLPARWAYALIRRRNWALNAFLFKRARAKPAETGAWLAKQAQAALGPAWRTEDFIPPYGPWEQRLCLIPDGDLFTALREGRASVVTGHIAAVELDGVRLADGSLVPADIIVTATGLRIAALGKVALSLDGVPVKSAEHFWYRDCMLSNVPNFAVLFGYLNASWTLRVDIVADWLCRLFRQMDTWRVDVVTPVLPADHGLEEVQPLDMFSSGYLQRAREVVPKSAASAPWRLHMDYAADRKELAEAPIDDGWLQFSRASARKGMVAASGNLVEPAEPA